MQAAILDGEGRRHRSDVVHARLLGDVVVTLHRGHQQRVANIAARADRAGARIHCGDVVGELIEDAASRNSID